MKKAIIIFIGALVVLMTAGGIYYNSLTNDTNIYPQVFVEDMNLGGMTKQEATAALEKAYQPGVMTFAHGDKKWEYPLTELGFHYNISDAVNKAFAVGREGGFFSNAAEIVGLNHFGKEEKLPLEKTKNMAAFGPIYETISQQINQEPLDATISIGDAIHITPEQDGYHVNSDKLKFETEKAAEEMTDQKVTVPVETVHPQVTRDYLGQINGVIGEYSTKFNNSIPGRNHNIRLAAKNISDVLLKPGEEFSFNTVNGAITLGTGYMNAPVIVKGVLQEGVGGGVCQVSSTLYNSVLVSGLNITARRNHSIPSGYVPIGRDATVSYNSVDFKFSNPYDYPIMVKSFVVGNTVTAKIYGNIYQYNKGIVRSQVVETIPRAVEYKNDPSLPQGKEVVEEQGRDGIKSVTYLDVNGQSKVVSRDTYPTAKKIIKKGTGAPEVTTPDPSQMDPLLNLPGSEVFGG